MGNSTPAIWKDVVFVTTQDKDRLLLLRLDRGSGKVMWEKEVGRWLEASKEVTSVRERLGISSHNPGYLFRSTASQNFLPSDSGG